MSTPTLTADDGLSMVEIMVSMVLLTVAMTALASTLTASLAQVADNQELTRANQLGTQLIEGMRSIAWDDLGVYADDPGYQSTGADGSPTVTLGAARPAGSAAPTPTRAVQDGGITFAATTDVVWVDDPNEPGPGQSDPDPRDYKEVRLRLVWQVGGTEYEASFTSARRPTVSEVPVGAPVACTPGHIVDYSVSPDFVELGGVGETEEEVTVTVETCTESSAMHLAPSPLSPRSMTNAGGGTLWTYTFPAGTTDYEPGEYTWTVTSSGTDGTATAEAIVQFATRQDDVLQIVGLTLDSGGLICVDQNRVLQNIALTAHVTGADGEDRVRFSWTSQSGDADGVYTGEVSGNGRFVGTLPAGHRFTGGTTTITVSATRTSDALNVSEAFVIDVVDVDTGGCPS